MPMHVYSGSSSALLAKTIHRLMHPRNPPHIRSLWQAPCHARLFRCSLSPCVSLFFPRLHPHPTPPDAPEGGGAAPAGASPPTTPTTPPSRSIGEKGDGKEGRRRRCATTSPDARPPLASDPKHGRACQQRHLLSLPWTAPKPFASAASRAGADALTDPRRARCRSPSLCAAQDLVPQQDPNLPRPEHRQPVRDGL